MSRKPYLPLMMGDWIKGTRSMRAEARGVYLSLLIHQYDQGAGAHGKGGYVPLDLESLTLIDPEVAKVWDNPRDFLKAKFPEILPGFGQNKRLEEVRLFWEKQRRNASKKRPPAKAQPEFQPNLWPKDNPNPQPNPTPALDLDNEREQGLKTREEGAGRRGDHDPRPLPERLAAALDERTVETAQMNGRMNYPGVDIGMETQRFIAKVLDAPDFYSGHTVGGLRLAFHRHLREAKPSTKTTTTHGNRKQQNTDNLIAEYLARHGGAQLS